MTRKSLACTVSAAALSLGAASAAMAATLTLNGGGATLPQPTYQNEFNTFSQATPTVLFSYDGVGSGAGQTAFLNNDITQFDSPSNQYGTIVGTTVDFGASDAFLNSTQVNSTGGYALSSTDGSLIQIPMIGVAVTIPYVNSGLTKVLVLNDSQICGVLSGKLTNWNQISKGATPGTIEVVYRSDGSGTTFLTTQHLNAVCTAANSSFPVLPVPVTKTFASLFTGGVPPSNFTGESGSAAVAAQLLATPLSFGYLSPDYTSIAPKSSNTTSLKVASVTNGINNVTYNPTVGNIAAGLTHPGPGSTFATPPSTQATAADPLDWIPSVPQTNSGYSIVGYTTWDLSTCYQTPAAGKELVLFLDDHFKTKAYQTLIENNGFTPLSNTAAAPYVTAISDDFLSNKSGYNLNIGNATACAGLAGR
jgi:phosphate transport system substrate-binding protein